MKIDDYLKNIFPSVALVPTIYHRNVKSRKRLKQLQVKTYPYDFLMTTFRKSSVFVFGIMCILREVNLL